MRGPRRAGGGTFTAEADWAGGLHARLAQHDPLTASRLRPTDSQRIARAWEVWRRTGTGLVAWQT